MNIGEPNQGKNKEMKKILSLQKMRLNHDQLDKVLGS